jgi:hypothetical protein
MFVELKEILPIYSWEFCVQMIAKIGNSGAGAALAAKPFL